MADNSTLREFIDEQVKARPVEAAIVKKLYEELSVTAVFDAEQFVPVKSLQDVYDQVFNLDEAFLAVGTGTSYVFLVMGQRDEIITDYTVDLEGMVGPVIDWINATYA